MRKPDKTFHEIGEFLKFVLESNKRYESDSLDSGRLDGKIKFTDGSYAECEYDPGSVSESGTWWPDSLDIKYYEPVKKRG